MTFLWIEMLWLLLIVPVFIGIYILIQRRRQKYALRYSSLSIVKEALGKGPGKRRHIPPILFLVGLAVMALAIARPVATVLLPSQQATIILTIDTSGSMRADDIKPSRLDAAKVAAKTFVEKQPKIVRIGVVSFSDSSAVVQAPTQDREAVLAAINRLVPQRGTAIGRGIVTSLDAIFEESGAKSTSTARDPITLKETKPPPPVSPGTYAPAIVILLSDGQSNVGPRPLDVIDQAYNRGVRVYTIGVGSTEGTVLHFVEGFSIRVRLDEDTLKQIANKTNAKYFRADNETELRTIYENLSTQLIFKPEQTELTAFFTGFAVLLLLTAGILSLLWFNRLP
jgi:Ca-activated chloride channel family protein